MLKHAAGLFSLGFALAAPVVFSILFTEFVLGWWRATCRR